MLSGIVIAVAVLTELRPGRDAVTRCRCRLGTAARAAAGAAAARRGRRRARAGHARRRRRAHTRSRHHHLARRGRHRRLRPHRSRRRHPCGRMRRRLLPRPGSARPAPRDGDRPNADVRRAGPRARRPRASAQHHEALPRGEDDRLRRVARLVTDRRPEVALRHRRSRPSVVRDRGRPVCDRDRRGALGPGPPERTVAQVAADSARRDAALLADDHQRASGRSGRPDVPRPARAGLVPRDRSQGSCPRRCT